MLKRILIKLICKQIALSAMLLFPCVASGQDLLDVPILGQGIRRVRQFRENLHEWEQTVRGFRRDHNFSLVIGQAMGQYKFERVGTVNSQNLSVTSYVSRFEYAFHLEFFGPVGGMLGSSFGYGMDASVSEPGRTSELVAYPGLVAGMVWNIDPGVRLGVAFDYHLERLEGVGEEDGTSPDSPLGVTTRSMATVLSLDVFTSLTWAFRAEFHDRWLSYERPAESEELPLDAIFSREDRWLALGACLHLL